MKIYLDFFIKAPCSFSFPYEITFSVYQEKGKDYLSCCLYEHRKEDEYTIQYYFPLCSYLDLDSRKLISPFFVLNIPEHIFNVFVNLLYINFGDLIYDRA